MFALASLFLGRTQAPSKWRRLDDSADVSQIAPHHGQDWANNAGHIASLQLQVPSVDTVRMLSNLTTYWFGIGQRERSQAGANLVIQAARDLQMQSSHLPKPQSRDLRWSCFWADTICRCFVLDDSFANSNQDMDISDITQPYNRFITKDVDNTLSVSLETRPTPGQEALFKALGLWREARAFIRNLRFIYNLAPEAALTGRWAALFALDSKIISCYSSFPTTLRNVYGGSLCDSGEVPELLLSLHAVYHQCRALLHLSMFMFLRQNASAPPDYVNLCARVSMSHLNNFADVATCFMSLAPFNASANPPFIAYCAFLTASIHLASLKMFQGSTGNPPYTSPPALALLRKRALSSLLVLLHLQSYWSSCKELLTGFHSQLDRLQPLCFPVRISPADIEKHGHDLRNSSDILPSTTIPDGTPLAPLPPHQEELENIMSRHLAQVLQMVDLSHPAYFSFQNLQSSHQIAGHPSILDQSANFYPQPYYTWQPEPEPTRISPIPGPQPIPYNAIVTEPIYPHHHKPRSWIPARPVALESTGFEYDEQDLE
ncbi:hypothetical protein N7481_008791 [Penicillium waksmanii]|uniref:uncharacterized protein n=1 Tax=Penicillium waksmanii TaxID=69791 RepID=UPI002548CE40|nr:uncharacterized protein N7481_008791 [Penicillium waksmanii]KAJ5975084.1 hypothetical protein N7481_008791 [Penicillium waksmanii]